MRNASLDSARTVRDYGALTNTSRIPDGNRNRNSTPAIAYSVANHRLITSNSAYCKANALEFSPLFHNAKVCASAGGVMSTTDAATTIDALLATGLPMFYRDKFRRL